MIDRFSQGFSMVEIFVALFLFSVGILGYAALQSQALRADFDAYQRSLAMLSGQELLERIRANPAAADLYREKINQHSDCDAGAPAKICADSWRAGTDKPADSCSPGEMAGYDLWDVLCNGDRALENALHSFRGHMECSNSSCTGGSLVELSLCWLAPGSGSNPEAGVSPGDCLEAPPPDRPIEHYHLEIRL